MLYMVIERFKDGNAGPVYQRFRERGRLMPPGLSYVSSWVEQSFGRCFQLVECDDAESLREWISQWDDLIDFEVTPVMTSAEAADAIAPRH
jgi:Protein of unknown function (DUF3303)